MQKHQKYRTAEEEIENQYVISADCPISHIFLPAFNVEHQQIFFFKYPGITAKESAKLKLKQNKNNKNVPV